MKNNFSITPEEIKECFRSMTKEEAIKFLKKIGVKIKYIKKK